MGWDEEQPWLAGDFIQAQKPAVEGGTGITAGCQGHREKRSVISMETFHVWSWTSKWFSCPSLLCASALPLCPSVPCAGSGGPASPGSQCRHLPASRSQQRPASLLQHPPASRSQHPGLISPPSIPVPPSIPPRPPPRGPSRLIVSTPSQWTSVAAGEGGGPAATRGAGAAGAEPAAGPRPLRYRLRAPPGPAEPPPARAAPQVRAVGAGAAPTPGPGSRGAEPPSGQVPGAASSGGPELSHSAGEQSIPVPPPIPRAPSLLPGVPIQRCWGALCCPGCSPGGDRRNDAPLVLFRHQQPLTNRCFGAGAGWPSGVLSPALAWLGAAWKKDSRAVDHRMLLWPLRGLSCGEGLHPPARAAVGDVGGLGSWQVCPWRVPGMVYNQYQQFRTRPWC